MIPGTTASVVVSHGHITGTTAGSLRVVEVHALIKTGALLAVLASPVLCHRNSILPEVKTADCSVQKTRQCCEMVIIQVTGPYQQASEPESVRPAIDASQYKDFSFLHKPGNKLILVTSEWIFLITNSATPSERECRGALTRPFAETSWHHHKIPN